MIRPAPGPGSMRSKRNALAGMSQSHIASMTEASGGAGTMRRKPMGGNLWSVMVYMLRAFGRSKHATEHRTRYVSYLAVIPALAGMTAMEITSKWAHCPGAAGLSSPNGPRFRTIMLCGEDNG